MIVVLDTNVILSAFIFLKGICSEVFELCIRNHSITLSEFILSEVKEKLQVKFYFNQNDIDDVIKFLLAASKIVKIKGNKINICRDKDDDNIIETAVEAKAEVIITGDKDLLVIKKFEKINIISPRQFYNFEKGFV